MGTLSMYTSHNMALIKPNKDLLFVAFYYIYLTEISTDVLEGVIFDIPEVQV